MKLSDDDLDIVLGRWDFSIGMAIEEVKRESIEGKDSVDKILEKRKESEEKSVKYCENGHRNEKPRANQKYCRVCKKELIANNEDNEEEVSEDKEYFTKYS